MRQAEVRDYYGAVLLYNFFGQLNFIKWKNSKLESCRSRRGLQFSYKNHLYTMSYRRIMIFQRFNWNKLEKKKTKSRHCSNPGVTVANPGRIVPCKPCKTGLDLGWTGSQVRGARCLVSKFMDLFDTALQVQVPTVHFTQFIQKMFWWSRYRTSTTINNVSIVKIWLAQYVRMASETWLRERDGYSYQISF